MDTTTASEDEVMVSKFPLLFYSCAHFLPILIYFEFFLVFKDPSFQLLIFSIGIILEFIFIKEKSGLDLIGIKWFIQPKENGTIVQFFSKPPPYIPALLESNVFWIEFFVVFVIWIITALVQRTFFNFLLCLFVIFSNSINFLIYLRGHAMTQKQATDKVRSTLFDEAIQFEMVEENEEDINQHVFHNDNDTDSDSVFFQQASDDLEKNETPN